MRMVLDEVIARLQKIREEVGGDAQVAHPGRGYVHYIDAVYVTKVGKSDPHRVVSRGGIPIVVLHGE